MKTMIAICSFAALLAACGQKQSAMAQPPSAPKAAAQQGSSVSGTVLETQNTAGYTYLRLKTADGEKWAAVPQTNVKNGAAVTVYSQMVAENFESTTLNRKFDKLIFGT